MRILSKISPLKGAVLALALFTSIPPGQAADSFDTAVEAGFDAILLGKFATLADYLHARFKQKDPVAAYVLGFMYEHGALVSMDRSKAMEHYRMSASLDYADAKLAIESLSQRIEASKSGF